MLMLSPIQLKPSVTSRNLLPLLLTISVMVHGLALYLQPHIFAFTGEQGQGTTLRIRIVESSILSPIQTKPTNISTNALQPSNESTGASGTHASAVLVPRDATQGIADKPKPHATRQFENDWTHTPKKTSPQSIQLTELKANEQLHLKQEAANYVSYTENQNTLLDNAPPRKDLVSEVTTALYTEQNNTGMSTQPTNDKRINLDVTISDRIQQSPAETTSDDTSNAEQRQHVLDRIYTALARHIEYPQRARRRGWEGEVLLAFNLSQRGHIDNIHVSRSSGYSLLDKSALDAMHKVKDISWRENQNSMPATDMEIPVLYRLKDG